VYIPGPTWLLFLFHEFQVHPSTRPRCREVYRTVHWLYSFLRVVVYQNLRRAGGRIQLISGKWILVRYYIYSILPPVAVETVYQTLLETCTDGDEVTVVSTMPGATKLAEHTHADRVVD
jgi:hypothetical protein